MSNPVPEDVFPIKSIAPGLPPALDKTGAFTPTQGGFSLAASVATDPLIGTIIGRYTLLKKLGEGGMGSVYLAEQSEPVKREVALKLIRGAADSRTIIARFEAERQALAVMDHPNIARIYDGGTTSTHQPYFVMELVQGVPITEFCDRHRFTPRQRLELFVPICQAVQHAHQKGIIHRDLKPGNVLVAEVDGKPVPKVIDFGVAKATEQPLTDQSLGDTGAIVGTPTYMSPEQADPESMDIDTRTDIYALGVMLYELLTGSTPIDAKQFRHGAMFEVLRMVREVDPPRPSTKLSTAEALPSIAANRNVEPKQLQAMLRGEIDWIVMKALEKDRTRRYETANGFAADVERYLTGEAVLAHPPSRWYQVKKFVKRNRLQVIAGALVIGALVAGLAVSLWQMNRAVSAEEKAIEERDEKERQRKRAENNEAKATGERDRAEREKAVAIAVRDFLQNSLLRQTSVMEQANQQRAQGRPTDKIKHDITVRELLDNAAREFSPQNIEQKFPNQPVVQAEILETIGEAYEAAADFDKAITYVKAATSLREKTLGANHPATLSSLTNLAFVNLTAMKYADALSGLLKALSRVEALLLSSSNIKYSQPADILSSSAIDSGEAAMNAVIEAIERRLDLRRFTMGSSYIGAAEGAMILLQIGQALPMMNRFAELSAKRFGEDDRRTWYPRLAVGFIYSAIGQNNLAMPIFERTLAKAEQLFQPDDLRLAGVREVLAITYVQLDIKREKVILLFKQCHDTMFRVLGPDHPYTIRALSVLAATYRNYGDAFQAIPLMKQVKEAHAKRLAPDHPFVINNIFNLGAAYETAQQPEEALQQLRQAIDLLEKNRFQDQLSEFYMSNFLGYLNDLKRYSEAEKWQRKWLAHVKEHYGATSTFYTGELASLGLNLLQQKKWQEAESVSRECLTLRQKKEPNDWKTFNTMSLLGGSLLGQKKYEEAKALLHNGYEGMKQREKSIPPKFAILRLSEAVDRLIQFSTETNKPDEVKKWQAEKEKLPKAPERKP